MAGDGDDDLRMVAAETLLAHLPARVAHTTLDGRLIFINRLAPGYTMEQVRGMSIFDFTDPAYHEIARDSLARVLETRETVSYANVAAGDHGAPTHYFTSIAPVIDDGAVTSVMFVATDVSPVRDAQRALKDSETRLRLALDAGRLGIWTYDPRTGDGDWDDATARLFGLPTGGPAPQLADIVERIHPDDRARVVASIERAFEVGTYGPLEHRIIRPDGGVRWASASGLVEGSGSARPGRLVGSVLDITDQRKQEEHLAQTAKLDSIGRLAGGVAHDFNNMLTAILSYTDLALAAVPAGSSIADDLTEIRLAAERSHSLTSRLLAFARKQRAEPRVVDPNVLVQQVARLLGRIVGEDVEIASSFGATRNIRIDPHQFEQLLLNLATNARDAMPCGGRLTIETLDVDLEDRDAARGYLEPGPYVSVRVTDAGTGMSPEVLEQAFEPFFTTKAAGQGTGLGLAQCYGIAKQAHGHVRISSEVGRGTTVSIELPAALEGEAVEMPKVMSAREAVPSKAAVLLVEDEPQVRSLAARVLSASGYSVLEAAGGAEALALAARHDGKIDILVTDMVMPGMKGTALAAELRRLRPTIAVLVMSGYSEELAADEGGADFTFLAKPFVGSALLAKVSLALGVERPRAG